MKRSRRVFLCLAGSAAALPALPRFASALDYPTRPVHLVVGFPAGLSPDILARLVGQPLSERLGQQFIVDNRPGAASNIGTEVVAHAAPDGYTVLLTISGNAINATLYTHLNFNFARDLTPVAAIGRTPFVIVVNPAFPVKSVPRDDRLCEGKSGQDQYSLCRPRDRTACRLRAVQDDDWRRYGPSAV
jgi:tripartite-type tricarboxylate transporter receptor subunit TctC